MSRNRIRKSEKREKKMIYEEGKRKYIIHQQPKYNSGQTLTIGRASLYLFPR